MSNIQNREGAEDEDAEMNADEAIENIMDKRKQNLERYPSRNTQSASQNSFITCLNCKNSFNSAKVIRKHLVVAHNVPEYDADELVLKNLIHQKFLDDTETTRKQLICSYCKEVFYSFALFWKHLHERHLRKSYEKFCDIVDNFKEGRIMCRFCKENLNKVVSLDKHMTEKHPNESIRACLLCDEECHGNGALLRHTNHHILGVQQCTICPCKYSTQRQFTSHLESFHENKYSVKCTQCYISFKSYALYEDHKNSEHEKGMGEASCTENTIEVHEIDAENSSSSCQNVVGWKDLKKRLFCKYCNIKFRYTSQYERHIYNCHPQVFRFRCEECECLFKNYGAMVVHQMHHIFGSHHCPHCNLKFFKVDQIKKHLKCSHPFVRGLECKLCIKIFKTYDTYLNHLKLKHPEASGNEITSIDCSICQKKFVNKYQLQLHKRSHKISTTVCEICGMNVKHLHSHMNSHTKVLRFPCTECGASYSSKPSLRIHCKRVHLADSMKKHICSECKKKFLSNGDLRIHTSRVHRGERKFICNYCDKAYKNKVSLSYHVRKHTGQKPHECMLCPMAFEMPTTLKQHLEKEHNARYKGIYLKNNLKIHRTSPGISDVVHINVPSDMRKEVVSSSIEKIADNNEIIVTCDQN